METKARKWVNPKLDRHIISSRQMEKILRRRVRWQFLDTRYLENPIQNAPENYHFVDSVVLNDFIATYPKRQKIVIISEMERTFVPNMVRARLLGYKRIFIYKAGKDPISF